VADLRVRQALLHGTNSQGDRRDAVLGQLSAATSVIASTAAGYVDLADKLGLRPGEGQETAGRGRLEAGADGMRQKDGSAGADRL
jgi:peptide/nickel transport system substrate-binding protein